MNQWQTEEERERDNMFLRLRIASRAMVSLLLLYIYIYIHIYIYIYIVCLVTIIVIAFLSEGFPFPGKTCTLQKHPSICGGAFRATWDVGQAGHVEVPGRSKESAGVRRMLFASRSRNRLMFSNFILDSTEDSIH